MNRYVVLSTIILLLGQSGSYARVSAQASVLNSVQASAQTSTQDSVQPSSAQVSAPTSTQPSAQTTAQASAQSKNLPDYQTFTLENGLQVVIIPNTRAPVVYHSIWYKVGSADSPSNKTGLAHFLEHLMFKGTKKFPQDTYKRRINDLGGEQNANTGWDRTAYFVTIAKEHLPIVIEMEADRMHNLDLTDDIVAKERDVVLQERRSTIDSKPEAILFEAANASFFWQHPYGKPVIGFEEHIQTYNKDDAISFYQKWYAPNNAVLVIAGDVKTEEIKPLIQKYYGALKPQTDLQPRKRALEPTHREATAHLQVRDPRVSGVFIQKIYRAPNFRTTSPHFEAVLTLLQDILGDSTDGRLSQSLVENQKLAHFVSANYIGYFYDPYCFTIAAAPINTADLQLLEGSIENETRRLINEGLSSKELDIAKEQWVYAALYRQNSLAGMANFFGENLSVGYGLKDLENWLPNVQKVTELEIKKAAKEILGVPPDVTLTAYPVAQK